MRNMRALGNGMRVCGRVATALLLFHAAAASGVETPGNGQDHPREIVIDTSAATVSSPSKQDAGLSPATSPLEQRARDNALLAGAVDLEPTLRVSGETKSIDREIVVHGGRCYLVSVAWRPDYRTTITYTFGRGDEGGAVNEFSDGDTAMSEPGEGVVQFCADRTGPVKIDLQANDDESNVDQRHEYWIVVGSRTETDAQREARRRCFQAGGHPLRASAMAMERKHARSSKRRGRKRRAP